MSRCMPFPPPGHVWNGVKGEALIKLIKVRREEAELKKQRKKEEKKKEKRRRKKEEELEEGEIKKKRHSHNERHKQHWSGDGNERSDNQARNEHEFRGIERTSLAEELKQPLTSDSLHEPFDTCQSTKRKRRERCHNHGSVVWINIRLQEHKDQELVFGKPVCSITAMDFLVQEKAELPNSCTKEQFFSTCSESTTALELDRPGVEFCHSWPQIELVRDGKAELALISQYFRSGLQHTEINFTELVVNWIPLPMESEHPESENLEWLYEMKPERLPMSDYTVISSASNDKLSNPISSLYPTAQCLAQADIYALPFTIPF